jgi:hypothetical protein
VVTSSIFFNANLALRTNLITTKSIFIIKVFFLKCLTKVNVTPTLVWAEI